MSKFVKAVAGVAILAAAFVIPGAQFLIPLGLSLVSGSLLAPSGKQQARQASETSLQLGEQPRQALFGETVTAGTLVDAFNFDGKYGTDWEALRIALADHECEELVGFYVDDKYVPFDYAGGSVPGFKDHLYVDWYPGTENQALYGVALRQWAPSDNLAGVAHIVVSYRADKPKDKNPVWPGGRPTFLFRVKGAKVYDARKDSTVAGGNGPQRWGQPSTWAWSDNPIVCRYNWVRGIFACGRVTQPDQLLIGRGLSAMEAPPENVAMRANICDELVPLKAGGSEKRYRFNGVIKADEEYLSVEETFAATCAGVIVQPGGSVEIEPGHARTPTFTITDADLIVGSNATWLDFRSEADSEWLNTVHVRYVEPSQKWADHEGPIRRNVADIQADGRPREDTVTLTAVTSATQAQRCGEIRRRFGRLLRSGTLTVGPRFCEIEEGDWGFVNSDRRTGGQPVLVRVESFQMNGDWQMQLTLREVSSTIYAWTAATDEIVDGAEATQPPSPNYAAPTTSEWSAASVTLTSDGGSIPAIRLTGAAPSGLVDGIVVEKRSTGTTAWESVVVLPGDATLRDIQGVKPGGSYEIGISYQIAGETSERLILAPVAAGSLATTTPDATVAIFSDIAAKNVSANAQVIRTLGYYAIGDGGEATYVPTTTAGATSYRTKSSDGRWWEIEADTPLLDQFGAKPAAATFDSQPFIQACIDWNEKRGGGMIRGCGRTYYLGSKLIIDPSLTSIEGAGTTLDWRLKTFQPVSTNPELVGDSEFDTGSGWITTANNTVAPTYTGGQLVFNDPPSDQQQFLEVGRKITAPAGATLRVTLIVGEILPVTIGANTFRTVLIGFRKDTGTASGSIAGGGISGATRTISQNDGAYAPGATFTFDVQISTANPYLRIQTNAAIKLNSISVKVVPDNTCILVQSGVAPNTVLGANARAVRGLVIRGTTSSDPLVINAVDGIVFNSDVAGYSGQSDWYDIRCSTGIGRGLVFQNRAYLIRFFGCRIVGRLAGIDTLPGAADAGENISFYGCSIGSGTGGAGTGTAINNPAGFQLTFFGTSFDFPQNWYVGKGTVEFHGCWNEKNQIVAAGQYCFDVQGGGINFFGGRLQVDGYDGTGVNDAPFRIADGAQMLFKGTNLSGLRGTTNYWKVGSGRLVMENSTGLSNSPFLIGTFDDDNGFGAAGGFEGSAIGVNAWIDSIGSNAGAQVDRYNLLWQTVYAAFYATATAGSVNLTASTTTPNTVAIGDAVTGVGIKPGTTVTAINNQANTVNGVPPNTVQISQAATITGTINPVYTRAAAGSAALGLSTTTYRAGAQSLTVTKTGVGSARPLSLRIAMPIQHGQRVGMTFAIKIAGNSGAPAGNTQLFCNSSFAQLVTSPAAVPTIAARQALTDQPITFDRQTGAIGTGGTTAGDGWTDIAFSSNAQAIGDGMAPGWATHVLLELNLVNCPAGFQLFVDGLNGARF